MISKNVRKKRMTAEERRAQIVSVATSLFARNGFKGTTTREIARKAGISEAVIFRHFSKKEALYTAIINTKCNDKDGQSRLLKALEGKSGQEVFREVASFLISEHQRDPTFMRLLTYSALEEHKLSDIFLKTKGIELMEYLAGHIRRLIREGLIRKVDPIIAARAFMGMVLHYSMSQEIYGLKRYYKRANKSVVDMFVEIFFEGLKRRQP
ncbi:MAG: TetR/AcrR family transcriptional regulator [Thermodesulfobacteriota bacterium]